jgi:hypothetical protein
VFFFGAFFAAVGGVALLMLVQADVGQEEQGGRGCDDNLPRVKISASERFWPKAGPGQGAGKRGIEEGPSLAKVRDRPIPHAQKPLLPLWFRLDLPISRL